MKRTVTVGDKEYGNLWLAPMAGDGDHAFRSICKKHGADYLCSEMVSAKAICYGDKKTPTLAKITPEEVPMAVQLFGSEPEFMAEAAKKILDDAKKDGVMPSAIDINAGCPVHKIVSNGEGSALMKDLPLLSKIVEKTVLASSVPVTVKMRLGWDMSSINVVDAAKCVEAAGASAVCVHARTRTQLYAPGVDISYIKKVKDAVKIPVIGNGDIFSAADAINMFEKTGCDGVAIARGALGNPWIFDEIRSALEGTAFHAPTVRERVDEALSQLALAVKDKGERTAVVESRKYLSRYVKGITGASKIRAELCTAESVDEIAALLEKLCRG